MLGQKPQASPMLKRGVSFSVELFSCGSDIAALSNVEQRVVSELQHGRSCRRHRLVDAADQELQGEKLPDFVKITVLLKTVNEPLLAQPQIQVGATGTVDHVIKMIDDDSRIRTSWTYSLSASTQSTQRKYRDSFWDPMEVDHVGINAFFQPKGKKGKGKGKEGKVRGESGQGESNKGQGSRINMTPRTPAAQKAQCPQRTEIAVDANQNESVCKNVCASLASASACRSMAQVVVWRRSHVS